MKIKNKFIVLWLIIGLIAGFATVIFFIITYLNDSVLCNLNCRIRNEVNLALIAISLFGLFIGSLTYYFISEKYEKKIVKIKNDYSVIYRFLNNDNKKIIKTLVENNGKRTQSQIVEYTGLSRVKISRCLKDLENRNIIKKDKNGMTNNVELVDELREVFVN
jgi:DNA-binding MarR family transcriptional regulator